MGRRPSNPGAVTRLRERKRGKKTYYYYYVGICSQTGKRKELALGSDYGVAIMEYAKLERDKASERLVQQVITFAYVADRYRQDVIPNKAESTAQKNLVELNKLLEFFNDPPAPLEAIQPVHVRQYLRWRSAAPVRANREKALLSAIWNYARAEGFTALANPCSGIKGHKETGRDVYIEDAQYLAVYQQAEQGLRDAMDLAYLTGQRVGDTLRMSQQHIKDDCLLVTQSKTNTKRRIQIIGELAALIARIEKRKAQLNSATANLLVCERGEPMTAAKLRARFDKAREAAGIEKDKFQFRDLRAKAGTDTAETSGDILKARDQLGHSTVVMTEHYVRDRKGKKVTPTR